MAVPALQSSTTFAAADGAVSATWNQGQLNTRRMLSVTIPELPGPVSGNLAGWVWAEVRTDQVQFVRADSQIVLYGVETAILLPEQYTLVVWRLSFIPVEKMTPRTGTFRYYTI